VPWKKNCFVGFKLLSVKTDQTCILAWK